MPFSTPHCPVAFASRQSNRQPRPRTGRDSRRGERADPKMSQCRRGQPRVLRSPCQGTTLMRHKHASIVVCWLDQICSGRRGSCHHIPLIVIKVFKCPVYLWRNTLTAFNASWNSSEMSSLCASKSRIMRSTRSANHVNTYEEEKDLSDLIDKWLIDV